jgi:hypothetical protein
VDGFYFSGGSAADRPFALSALMDAAAHSPNREHASAANATTCIALERRVHADACTIRESDVAHKRLGWRGEGLSLLHHIGNENSRSDLGGFATRMRRLGRNLEAIA